MREKVWVERLAFAVSAGRSFWANTAAGQARPGPGGAEQVAGGRARSRAGQQGRTGQRATGSRAGGRGAKAAQEKNKKLAQNSLKSRQNCAPKPYTPPINPQPSTLRRLKPETPSF